MDNSFICNCGNDVFWFFIDHVRCAQCFSEYKQVTIINTEHLKKSRDFVFKNYMFNN